MPQSEQSVEDFKQEFLNFTFFRVVSDKIFPDYELKDLNKKTPLQAAGFFCSPEEMHSGVNTQYYAPEARKQAGAQLAEGIKLFGTNK